MADYRLLIDLKHHKAGSEYIYDGASYIYIPSSTPDKDHRIKIDLIDKMIEMKVIEELNIDLKAKVDEWLEENK